MSFFLLKSKGVNSKYTQIIKHVSISEGKKGGGGGLEDDEARSQQVSHTSSSILTFVAAAG